MALTRAGSSGRVSRGGHGLAVAWTGVSSWPRCAQGPSGRVSGGGHGAAAARTCASWRHWRVQSRPVGSPRWARSCGRLDGCLVVAPVRPGPARSGSPRWACLAAARTCAASWHQRAQARLVGSRGAHVLRPLGCVSRRGTGAPRASPVGSARWARPAAARDVPLVVARCAQSPARSGPPRWARSCGHSDVRPSAPQSPPGRDPQWPRPAPTSSHQRPDPVPLATKGQTGTPGGAPPHTQAPSGTMRL